MTDHLPTSTSALFATTIASAMLAYPPALWLLAIAVNALWHGACLLRPRNHQ